MEKPILEQDALFKLLRKLMAKKRLFIRNGIIGTVLGLFFAFTTIKTYTSEIVLAPEMNDGTLGGGSLSGLAAMAGINLGASSTEAIYPELYPQMISSTPFVVEMMGVKVRTLDGTVETDLYDYIRNKQKKSLFAVPKMWARRAMAAVLSVISKPIVIEGRADGVIDPFCLSKEQEEVARAISEGTISAYVNKKDQIITLSATSQDPLISASLVDTVRVKLQESITDYRTKKARLDLDYSEKLLAEAAADYEKAKDKYVAYAETHQDAYLESVKTRMSNLENEMSLAFQTYSQVQQQYNAAKAKVQERTPSFTIIQPATVSVKPSSTPKIMVLLLWVFLFFVGTFVWVLTKDTLRDWKKEITRPDVSE